MANQRFRGTLWAAYLRQNTANPDGLVDQLDNVIGVAERNGGQIVANGVFFDIASGRALDRPGLLRLRAGVRSGQYGAVVIDSPARLSRDPTQMREVLTELRDYSVRLIHG